MNNERALKNGLLQIINSTNENDIIFNSFTAGSVTVSGTGQTTGTPDATAQNLYNQLSTSGVPGTSYTNPGSVVVAVNGGPTYSSSTPNGGGSSDDDSKTGMIVGIVIGAVVLSTFFSMQPSSSSSSSCVSSSETEKRVTKMEVTRRFTAIILHPISTPLPVVKSSRIIDPCDNFTQHTPTSSYLCSLHKQLHHHLP
jgi:hypothetical protein